MALSEFCGVRIKTKLGREKASQFFMIRDAGTIRPRSKLVIQKTAQGDDGDDEMTMVLCGIVTS